MPSISKKILWYKICLCSGQYHERKNCQKLLIALFILIFVFISLNIHFYLIFYKNHPIYIKTDNTEYS